MLRRIGRHSCHAAGIEGDAGQGGEPMEEDTQQGRDDYCETDRRFTGQPGVLLQEHDPQHDGRQATRSVSVWERDGDVLRVVRGTWKWKGPEGCPPALVEQYLWPAGTRYYHLYPAKRATAI